MASYNESRDQNINNSHSLILEARRNGETYLATQMQLAIAADQRAMTLGSILAAASSVLLGFSVSGDNSNGTMIVLFLAISAALAVACALAFYSARPVMIKPPGNTPAGWYDDMEDDTPIEDALRADLAVIQRSIESNSTLMAAHGRILWCAMVVAGAAVLLAPIAALAAYALRCQ